MNILMVLMMVISQGYALRASCPLEATVNQTVVAPAGWRAVATTKKKLPLSTAEITSGSPGTPAQPQPETTRTRRGLEVKYHFPKNSDEELWLVCAYGDSTSTIAKPVGKASECVVVFGKGSAIHAECKR